MALNITRNIDEITDSFGGVLKLVEVDQNGTLVASSTAVDMGYIVGTEWNDKSSKSTFKDDTKKTVKTAYRDREVSYTTNLMQSGSAILSIPEEVIGKYYRAYSYKNDESGNTQHRIYPIVTFNPDQTVKQGDEKIKIELDASPVASALTLSASSLTGSLNTGGFALITTATTVTISANRYYVDWNG
jgi:hypothetical protein